MQTVQQKHETFVVFGLLFTQQKSNSSFMFLRYRDMVIIGNNRILENFTEMLQMRSKHEEYAIPNLCMKNHCNLQIRDVFRTSLKTRKIMAKRKSVPKSLM
jgi:hypothetical protein